MSLLPKITPRSAAQRQAEAERELLQQEAELGGKLFGALPKSHRRQFFCLDERTWVWHEEWQDEKGERKVVTTRYIVRPNGILKSQNGHPTQLVSPAEAQNFFAAAKLYIERVRAEYQRLLHPA